MVSYVDVQCVCSEVDNVGHLAHFVTGRLPRERTTFVVIVSWTADIVLKACHFSVSFVLKLFALKVLNANA